MNFEYGYLKTKTKILIKKSHFFNLIAQEVLIIKYQIMKIIKSKRISLMKQSHLLSQSVIEPKSINIEMQSKDFSSIPWNYFLLYSAPQNSCN
jgi:hypothetical protein